MSHAINYVWVSCINPKCSPVRNIIVPTHQLKNGVINQVSYSSMKAMRVTYPSANTNADGFWCAPEQFSELALPTLMKKIVSHASE